MHRHNGVSGVVSGGSVASRMELAGDQVAKERNGLAKTIVAGHLHQRFQQRHQIGLEYRQRKRNIGTKTLGYPNIGVGHVHGDAVSQKQLLTLNSEPVSYTHLTLPT